MEQVDELQLDAQEDTAEAGEQLKQAALYKAKSKKHKLCLGLAAVGVVGGVVATGGVGGAVVVGVAGGAAGYGVGKGNERMVKKRLKETKFDHVGDSNEPRDDAEGEKQPKVPRSLAFQHVIEVRRKKFACYLKDNQL